VTNEPTVVLLSDRCPTGRHVGVVHAERHGECKTMGYETPGRVLIPFPLRYQCGCER
jgi:hypothetical protein